MVKPKEKIAILGGGLGGATAAYALTDPELKDRYDVTVYTMGWRLGGKGASGRDAEHSQRVLEHGLHIWFGCYDNSFTMMRKMYDEIARQPEAPLSTLETAFRPQNTFVLNENVNDEWRQWEINFPMNDAKPGGHPSMLEFLEILMRWMRRAMADAGFVPSKSDHEGLDSFVENIETRVSEMAGDIAGSVEEFFGKAMSFLEGKEAAAPKTHAAVADKAQALHAEFARHICVGEKANIVESVAAEVLKGIAEEAWDLLSADIPDDDVARRTWIFINLGTTIMRGILLDDLPHRGVDAINSIEGRDWLRQHASVPDDAEKKPNELAFNSPLIRALYDACFAYREGRVTQPDFSAATLLRACLWLPFSYKGAFCYEMQAGMGDTVFTPFYQALIGRGVKFEFFTQVVGVEADESGTSVTRINLEKQVALKNEQYLPLVKVKDLLCWPATPHFDQIVDGDKLRSAGVNLEHYDSGWKNTGPSETLNAGEDFDHVVMAIPLPAHRAVCPDLIATRPAWQAAVDHVDATRTCAAQLWFGPTRQELGVGTPAAVTGAYVEPWSSLADFSHILLREEWGDTWVNTLTYTCGVFPYDVARTQAEALEWTHSSIKGYLTTNAAPLWPNSAGADGQFNWDCLISFTDEKGSDRLNSQYLRANIDLNELYILSTHGGMDYRPKVQAAGLENLFFAGDWTNNGFNISSVEGTVISGLQASRAISGFPKDIVGEDPKSLSPSDK